LAKLKRKKKKVKEKLVEIRLKNLFIFPNFPRFLCRKMAKFSPGKKVKKKEKKKLHPSTYPILQGVWFFSKNSFFL
jgi:hypothetical protein